MAVGKISEFVDEPAFAQLEKLSTLLGTCKQSLTDNIVEANRFNQALSNSKGIASLYRNVEYGHTGYK